MNSRKINQKTIRSLTESENDHLALMATSLYPSMEHGRIFLMSALLIDPWHALMSRLICVLVSTSILAGDVASIANVKFFRHNMHNNDPCKGI